MIGPRVERGLGYVALGPAGDSLAFLQSLAQDGRPQLWITDRASPPAGAGQVLLVTALAGREGTVDPKRLHDLRAAAVVFASGHAAGLVVVDCLESLVLHNGAERVLRSLADLHDEVTMNGGSLIVLVDSHAANPRLVAWLERELDVLCLDGPSAGEARPLSV